MAALGVVLWSFVGPAYGADQGPPLQVRHYTTEEGLPMNLLKAVEPTRDGFAGSLRTPGSAEVASALYVHAFLFAETPSGALVLSSEQGLLYHLDSSTPSVIPPMPLAWSPAPSPNPPNRALWPAPSTASFNQRPNAKAPKLSFPK